SKIQGGTQYDRETADDFDLNATITRVRVRGSRGGYNMPPNPTYYGVYVRFYDGAAGAPGALQAEHFLPQGTPGVLFDAANPNTFDITLPAPFTAVGKHFLSVQPVFGGSETWSVSSGNDGNVRGSVWFKRDRAANEAWTQSVYAGRLNDMAFDLFGTLLSAPRIDAFSPNPVPRSGLVRISGGNFGARGDGQLTIDGKPSQYIAHWADNLIVAYVPENSTLGGVPVVVTSSGMSGTATLNVTTRPSDGRIRWRFTVASGHTPRRPAVAPDGTVYVNDVLGRLYALAPDGGLKWVFQAGLIGARGPVSVGADGTVYVGGLVPKNPSMPCEGDPYTVNVHGIFAVRPDGTQKWLFDKTCDNLLSGPNVGPDGNIHAVTEQSGLGAFALKPDGTLAHAPHGRFGVDGGIGTEIVFGPAAPGEAPTRKYFQYESGGLYGYTLTGQQVFLYPTNAVGITQPVAGQRTGTVYTVPDHQTAGRLFAVSPQGALRWVSPIQPISSLSIPDAPPSESAVYVVQDGAKLHRVNPSDGSVVWTFNDNNEQLFDPIASPDDRLVLMGGQIGLGLSGFFEA
ncbi:MAG TPA: PQQ-binding-like beta-propeller repeat protein, partial [Pyrinomonadaceae bacterium]|nr:PQQ-binding-like beta-propeller repeat protein [Pyrinomonadaceae bacterium]